MSRTLDKLRDDDAMVVKALDKHNELMKKIALVSNKKDNLNAVAVSTSSTMIATMLEHHTNIMLHMAETMEEIEETLKTLKK